MTKVKYDKYKYLALFFLPFLIVTINNHSSFATCSTDSNTGVVTCSESASASVTVAEACTMTATTSPAHTATLANGIYSGGVTEYEDGIGKTTLKVVCNDASGFSIYAVGYTNNEYGNTKLMSNEQDATAPIINTGTAESGNTSAWSMKLTSVTGTYAPTLDNSFGSYHSVPSTYTRVAYRTSGTDVQVGSSEATGSSVDTTYAAFISPTQPAGTYVGKVKYTLVHPYTDTPKDAPITCLGNRICYSPNANDVEGTMGTQITTGYYDYTLLASNFSRKGYGFAGWSESQNAATDPTAKIYGPQERISTSGLSTKGLSLYAVWVKSVGSLQDSTKVATLCSTGNGSLTQTPTDGTANITSISALTDQRDNETYAIAKLSDGNCWMIENLRLENTAAHNSDGSLAQGYGTSSTFGNFSGLADPEAPSQFGGYNTNNLYSTNGNNDTIGIGSSNFNYRIPRYNNTNNQINSANRPQNPTTNSNTNNSTNAGMYSYGNYYTWHAAIADTTQYVQETHNTTSICPAGWRIPTGDTSGEFSTLYSTANGNYTVLRNFPYNFIFSGYISEYSVAHRGSYGYYWSSTAGTNIDKAYMLEINQYQTINPGTGSGTMPDGLTIRCIATIN